MVKVTEQDFYMDGYLKQNLDTAKSVIKKDWDMLFCVDGPEGSGKSVFALQCAYYCDPSFTNDKIAFTPKQFRQLVMKADPYTAIVYDEAYTGLSSRATMSLINRTLISMLAEIRQRNLFVFVVMPTFFDLDKYVALWRSRALVNIYTGDNFQRGYFSFYNADRKKQLYVLGKKFYNYSKPNPNFRGRFANHYTVDEKTYRKNKRNALLERERRTEEIEMRREMEEMMFNRLAELGDKLTHDEKIDILKMPRSTYFYQLKKWKESMI